MATLEAIRYKEYDLIPRPVPLRDGTFTTEVRIKRGADVVPFTASNQWPTHEEAVRHSLEFGRRIVDGEVPGVTLTI